MGERMNIYQVNADCFIRIICSLLPLKPQINSSSNINGS